MGGKVVSQSRRAKISPPCSIQPGLRYAHGAGVAKDEVEAVKWYRKAAEQNDASRLNTRWPVVASKGEGIAMIPVEAVKWYRKAAEQITPGLNGI